MAVLIWMHAGGSTQPPIYDAFTYYSKARHVWDSLSGRSDIGLLDAEPGFRPPGTVLMAFPFGFDGGFSGFYFRSVFFPIVLVVAAVLVAVERKDVLSTLVVAAFLSTLSLFFYFEPYDGGPPMVAYWGLVDNFLTGLAAFAAGCAVRSIRLRSLGWGFAATVVGVLMIYVKPSGALVAAIVATTLMSGWLLASLRGRDPVRADRARAWRQTLLLGCAQVALLGGAVWLALDSDYLGAKSMAFGNASLAVMRSELRLDLVGLAKVIHGGLGPFIPLWIAAAAVLLWVDRRQSSTESAVARSRRRLFIGAAVLTMGVGTWFWLVASGGQTQIRYFTPFLYAAVFFALDPLVDALSRRAKPVVHGSIAFMAMAIVNTVLLLAWPHPPLAWQLASGVNVMSGSRSESLGQARSVIAATIDSKRPVIVYSLTSNIADAMYESAFHLRMLDAPAPFLVVRRPIDWSRPSMFRIDEIAEASYLVFDPRPGVAAIGKKVPDFYAEQLVFQDWARHLSRDDGVERLSVRADSVLMRIVDPVRLRASLDELIGSHDWRPSFVAENRPRWWSDRAVDTALLGVEVPVTDIRFGDRFEVRAAIARSLPGREVELTAWVRPLLDADDAGWVMLVHGVDSSGNILVTADVALGPLAAPPNRPQRYLQRRFVLPQGSVRIAIGFYRDSTLLVADRGDRDWGGKRVLVSIPSGPAP